MANYIKDITTQGIKNGSAIAFTLDNEEKVIGRIIESCKERYFVTASRLFYMIGLKDPLKFFKDTVGEENVTDGGWPYVKGEDNLRKVLKALWDYKADRIPESKKVISDDEGKPFTLSIRKKNKGSTLNFRI